MGKNKKKRQEAEQVAAKGSWLGAKGPGLRFVLFSAAFMFFFYAVFYSTPEESPGVHEVIQKYLGVYASAAGAILGIFSDDVNVMGTTIHYHGSPVQVARGCDAMEPIALYIAAVIAIGVPLRPKLVGLFAGVPFLMLLNLGRIIALTVISRRLPGLFDAAHLTVGQTLFIIATVCVWFVWVVWAAKVRKEPDAAAAAD